MKKQYLLLHTNKSNQQVIISKVTTERRVAGHVISKLIVRVNRIIKKSLYPKDGKNAVKQIGKVVVGIKAYMEITKLNSSNL